MKYAFIQTWERFYSVKLMCRVLMASRSGYYEWRSRGQSEREVLNQRLDKRIEAVYKLHEG